MLSGDNGILQKATDAKTRTDESQIKERIQLAYHSALTDGQGGYTKQSLEDELKKEFVTDYSVDDSNDINWTLNAKGQSVIIPAGEKKIIWSSASEIFDNTGTLDGKMHIGDYVNYPVYYDNVIIRTANSLNIKPKRQYVGWRVMEVKEDDTETYVTLLSAGVPIDAYSGKGNSFRSVGVLGIPFGTSSISTDVRCGFRTGSQSSDLVTSKEQLVELFLNKYTQIRDNGSPEVRSMTNANVEKLVGKDVTHNLSLKGWDLLGIPAEEDGVFVPYWLNSQPSGWWYVNTTGLVYNGTTYGTTGWCGVRFVVSLKPDVKYSLSPENNSELNNIQTWNIQ